jgi:hypothetical protein
VNSFHAKQRSCYLGALVAYGKSVRCKGVTRSRNLRDDVLVTGLAVQLFADAKPHPPLDVLRAAKGMGLK